MTKYTVARTVTTVMYQYGIEADTPDDAEVVADNIYDWEDHETIIDYMDVWED